MQFNKRFWVFSFLAIGLIVLFLSHMYSAYILRPLWNDGAFWLFHLLNKHELFLDGAYARYVTYLPQYIPYLLMHLFPGRLNLAPEIYSYTFFYGLFPYFVLTGSAFYLHKKKSLSLLWFPLLHLVLIHCSAQSFYVNVTTDASFVLWPLVFIFWFEESWKVIVYSIPGLYIIWIGYELAPIYFGCLILIASYRYRIQKNISKNIFIFLFTTLSILGLVYFYNFIYLKNLNSSAHVNKFFITSLLAKPKSLALFSWLSLIVLMLATIKFITKYKWLPIVLLTCAFGYCLYETISLYDNEVFILSYHARTTVYLRTFLLVLLFIAYDYLKKTNLLLGLTLGFGLILAVLENHRSNTVWAQGMENLNSLTREHHGCVLISQKRFKEELGRYAILDWPLPYISVLQQKSQKPQSIIFTERDGYEITDQYLNPCRNQFDNEITSYGIYTFSIPIKMPGFQFSFFKDEPGFALREWVENRKVFEMNFWTSTTITSQKHLFKKGIPYQLVIPMRGTSVQGVFPEITVLLAGEKIQRLSITGVLQNYKFDFIPKEDTYGVIEVIFLNDAIDTETGEDINLHFGGLFLSPWDSEKPTFL